MPRIHFSRTSKFLIGVISGAIMFSGSAIALNDYVSDNTPENGYLLCANLKTKAVTFPNKLSCPSGTKALDMGAVTGIEGPEGPQGPQGYTGPQGQAGATGPAGNSAGAKTYTRVTPVIDIVADGSYSTFAALKKVVIAKIGPQDMPLGFYSLSAYVEGLWADNVPDGATFNCYFQYKKDFEAGSTNRLRGATSTQNGSWTGIYLNPRANVYFYGLSDDPVYLICAAGGTVKSLDAYLIATSIETSLLKNSLG